MQFIVSKVGLLGTKKILQQNTLFSRQFVKYKTHCCLTVIKMLIKIDLLSIVQGLIEGNSRKFRV